jgi:flagellar hook-associated protein 1 FlgK
VPGLFGIYEMSKRSLLAYQTAMHNVGHNVANAGMEGFHRQRVELGVAPTAQEYMHRIGTGITVDSIRRIEDRFLEQGILRELPVLAAHSARAGALAQAETLLGEPSEGGIATLLDQFYDGWDDLASTPEDGSVRGSVIRVAVSVADAVRSSRIRLESQAADVSGEIRATLDDFNRALRELAEVNRRILSTTAGGAVVADLEDRRDRLAATLAELGGTTSAIDDDGTAMVWLAERVVVQREIVQEVGFEPGTGQPLTIEGRAVESPNLGGRIGGLFTVRDEDLAEAIRRLDEFAARLAEDVNAIHSAGVDEHGRPAGAFFVLAGVGPDGVGAAQRLEVSAAIVADASRVAAGRVAAPGENGVALDIAALRNDPKGASGMLQSLVVELGGRSREAQDMVEAQSFVVESFRAQRESVSGVSLDEEAAHLLQFQRSYEAAARVLAAADEMARTILAL